MATSSYPEMRGRTTLQRGGPFLRDKDKGGGCWAGNKLSPANPQSQHTTEDRWNIVRGEV